MRYRHGLYLLGLALLCQCSVKHQPVTFDPHFYEGYDASLPRYIAEREELLKKPSLTVLEKKRLLDLYDAELKTLRPSTPRYDELKALEIKLFPEVSSVQKEVDALSAEDKSDIAPLKTPQSFKDPALKRAYSQAQQFWNREQNDQAFIKVNEILSLNLVAGASPHEIFRVFNLRFRIAIDVGNDLAISDSFKRMTELEPCAPETAQAALIYAFRLQAAGNPTDAAEVFTKSCDLDVSPANQMRRKYWSLRFTNASPNLYGGVLEPNLPGYYSFLAAARASNEISVPKNFATGNLGFTEFNVSGRVHKLLLSAEESLSAGLRKDASVYLQAVARKFKNKEVNKDNVTPMIYTASLLQAAGSHLEAIKLLSSVQSYLISPPKPEDMTKFAFSGDLVSRMFPRPFPSQVEWLSKMWNVDPDFVYAIMRQESAFNPEATSATNARGLMQMMPSTAKQLQGDWKNGSFFNERVLYSPGENLKVAIYYIHELNEILPHPALVAAAYNGGFHRVIQWIKKFGWLPMDAFIETIPFNETRNYVKLVMRNYVYYKSLRTEKPVDGKLLTDALPYIPASASTIGLP